MQKLISEGNIAMGKIMTGVDLVANPVKSSIGPLGRTTIIAQAMVAEYSVQSYPITISKDGYRISQSIKSGDAEVQVGIMLINEACEKTMIQAGDGTSTTALFVQAILDGGLKLIESGISHVEVKNGIMKAVDYVVGELKKMSTPINGDTELIRQIATVSANGDTEIGDLIAEAFSKIGDDGVIDIEEAKGITTSIKISAGLKFHKGWLSPYFVTNKSKAECVLENPLVLIYDRPITILKDLMPILEKILTQQQLTGVKRPLMIFADDADSEALATLTYNTQQGSLQSCVVAMAFLGDKKKAFMEDIASSCGGTFINELKGIKLENIELKHLGQAQKVVVGKEDTVIIGGLKDEAVYNKLVEDIKSLIEKEEDTNEKELLKKRLARLKGSVAMLSIGGTTEVEMKERFDRADDSRRATMSAIEEGFSVGGGTAFLRIQDTGNDIINSILTKPLEQICENAARDYGKISDEVMELGGNYGYNAKTNKIEDLAKAGIIEPTKSNRCALQNAASVVCAVLTSKYMIVDTL